MKEYNKILIPTDGSETSALAVSKGLSLAKLAEASVTAVYVVERPHYLGEALLLDPPDEKGYIEFYEKFEKVDPGVDELGAYEGSYHSEELGTDYTFHVEDGKLVLRNRKIGKKELEPTYKDGFTFQGYGMTFTRTESGRVDGFTLSSGRVRRVRFDKN